MNKPIVSPNAPAAVGPYVHAVEANGTLYCSGQLGIDPATGELLEGIEAQSVQALKNLGAVLEESGYKFTDVVKTTVFMDSIADFGTFNEIYAGVFADNKPARSCFEVGKLPKGGLVEIECIAVK